jgi:hypothetical protein
MMAPFYPIPNPRNTHLVAFAGPASAQGGCQAFGHSVAEDAQEFQPLGQNFVRGAAPLNDEALTEHEQFCG